MASPSKTEPVGLQTNGGLGPQAPAGGFPSHSCDGVPSRGRASGLVFAALLLAASSSVADPLLVRARPSGCRDLGVVASFVAAGSGSEAAAGVVGNCVDGVAGIAAYGSLDGVGVYTRNAGAAPLLSLDRARYDATHVYPAAPLTPAQQALVRPYTYVLTNTEPRFASYALSVSASAITLVGWAALGGGDAAAGQVPPARLAAGQDHPVALIGAPTALFARDTVVELGGSGVATAATAEEYDVVNDSHVFQAGLQGVAILGMGDGGQGTALTIGGTAGYRNAFTTGLAIENFRRRGIRIAQPAPAGGVGLDVEMSDGVALNVGRAEAGRTRNVFQVDAAGDVAADGTMRPGVFSVATLPRRCAAGQIVYVSDGRNPTSGEDSGVGAQCDGLGRWLVITPGSVVTR